MIDGALLRRRLRRRSNARGPAQSGKGEREMSELDHEKISQILGSTYARFGEARSRPWAWTVLIREGRHWRVLAHYREYSEARRSSCATRADGTPVKILPFGDPRIERLLCGRSH